MPERLTITCDAALGFDPAPVVQLQNWFDQPYDNAVATARTCYSSRVVYPEQVAKTEKARALRDRIASSTYKAGHHTTIQHPTFQFVLKRVSRQLIWSFLHQHPFYNSEQVSQRYVKVKQGKFTVPPLPSDAAREVYVSACERQMAAYEELIQLLRERTDCVAAELHVKAENAGAMSFYKRFGFEIDPEHGFSRDHYYIEGHNYHAFYMRYRFVPRRNRWCTLL